MVDYKKPLKIVLSGHDLDAPLTNLLNEASVKASLEPSLDFLELVEASGFTRRGRFAWSAPTVDNGAAIAAFLRGYAKDFLPQTMISLNEHYTEEVPIHAALYAYSASVQSAVGQTSNFLRLLNDEVADFSMRVVDGKVSKELKEGRNEWNGYNRWGANNTKKRKEIGKKFSTLGGVSVEYKNGVVWVRVFPNQSIALLADTIHMPKTRHVRYSQEKYMTPRELSKLVSKIEEEYGDDVLDSRSDDVVVVFGKAEKSVTVGYQANEPGTVYISVGDDVEVTQRHALYKYRGKTTKVALSTALEFDKKYGKKIDFFIHPALNDVVRMQKAKKYEGDERLFGYQKEAVGLHLATSLGYLQSCSPGMGKGHPLTTNVLTPTGWKQVGDLQVGDQVFSSNGKPTTITGVYPKGVLDVYRVSFNDGSNVLVDGDHLWAVQTKEGLIHSKEKQGEAKYLVKSTEELIGNLTRPDGTNIWRIPMTEPVQYENAAVLPVPAYTLGVLLGDGSISQQTVVVTSADEDLKNLLVEDLEKYPEMEVREKTHPHRTTTYRLVSTPVNKRNPMKDSLTDLGLMGTHSHTKFIPKVYSHGNLADRIALFQGLMDTDGYFDVKRRHLQWGSVSKELADGMAELVESFGGTVKRTVKHKSYTDVKGERKTGKPYHSLALALPDTITPFRLQRKLTGYTPRVKKPVRIITSIEPAGQEEVRCISVAAENRLYLTEHHIVTHNTVIQLAAMREKARHVDGYRALVVCEAVVRPQWVEEAAVWFPEAVVYAVGSAKETEELAEALSSTEPVVIICSYAQLLLAYEEREKREARELRLKMMGMFERITYLREEPVEPLNVGSLLLDMRWEDICADEAVVLRNGTSKQANILWTLRKNSKVATALTATPINREADDIARLISWVRNDRTMFTGKSLADMYDLETEEGAKKLAKSFGPLVFRRDISEVKGEMPSVVQKVELLDPSPAEKALASAAEKELKRCYMELMAALEEVEKTDNADKEQLKKVKTQLKEANGAWLGGTQLARMAVSDPTALLSSTSVGAALLRGQGLIEAAMQDEPTKRKKFIQAAQKYVAEGKQILVFTDFIDVAEALVEALVENGFNAKAYTGKNGAVRDRARKEFQDGTLDIMVCTKVAERGLTLHKAAVLYHYDLPWTLEKIIQRTGRSIRIGSENETVTIVFMVMKGTVEQRMATQLVTAGMTASLVMDKSRGVDVSKTETASAMSGLMTTMAGKSDNKNLQKFGKMLLGV